MSAADTGSVISADCRNVAAADGDIICDKRILETIITAASDSWSKSASHRLNDASGNFNIAGRIVYASAYSGRK